MCGVLFAADVEEMVPEDGSLVAIEMVAVGDVEVIVNGGGVTLDVLLSVLVVDVTVVVEVEV